MRKMPIRRLCRPHFRFLGPLSLPPDPSPSGVRGGQCRWKQTLISSMGAADGRTWRSASAASTTESIRR